MPKWVRKDTILAIHAYLLKEHGGLSGKCNEGALEATLARPLNLQHYGTPSLFDLATSYGYGFVQNHCFPDGNKRVALMVIHVFLSINGFELNASEIEAVEVMRGVASGEITEPELAVWIKQNSIRNPA